MITARGLSLTFPGGGGIRDVDFSLAEGGSVAVIGRSGSGKTTLLHCIAGLRQPESGSVEMRCAERPRVGFVQQRDALFPWLTVARNIELGLPRAERSSKRGEMNARIRDVAGTLAIEPLLARWPHGLSGGERQRVSIARALVGRPRVLLFDEPSSALDAFAREALQDTVLELQQRHRLTAVFVTHQIEEALFLASDLLVLADGSIAHRHHNPIFPDPQARTREEFYRQAIAVRALLEGGEGGRDG